jgi:Prohead core protein serine protease
MQKFLIEELKASDAMIVEQRTGQDLFLSGIMMMSEVKNGNGRIYKRNEMCRVVEEASKKIADGHYIVGELNHPDVLSINLANVSHAITEIKMDGNNAVGKMKILNTPSGLIAKALIDGGVRLGVSSRGTGEVNESSGEVSDFLFTTMDIVGVPSAPNAYPNVVREALENSRVLTLAEAMVHDKKAQAYLAKEIKAFLQSLK